MYYYDSGMKVEVFEIAARDNMKKSLLITPVPLSFGSQLEWVGFNVVSGKFFPYLIDQLIYLYFVLLCSNFVLFSPSHISFFFSHLLPIIFIFQVH